MQKEDFNKLVQSAREKDLLSFFQESGYTIERHQNNYYIKEIPGLCINPDKNQWYSHYTNTGRTNNSIDCLTQILNYNFNQAVYALTGQDITNMRSMDYPKKQAPLYTSPPKSEETPSKNKVLRMPEQAPNMRQMFAYFCQTRKIPYEIVEEFVHAKLLYQSQNTVNTTVNGVPQTYKNANAVFVHRNENGEAIGGEIDFVNST